MDRSSQDAATDFASEQPRPAMAGGDSGGAALDSDASLQESDGSERGYDGARLEPDGAALDPDAAVVGAGPSDGDAGLERRVDECGRTLVQKNSPLRLELQPTDDLCRFRLEADFADLDVTYLLVSFNGEAVELSMDDGFVVEEGSLRFYGAACDVLASPDAGRVDVGAALQVCPVREPWTL